MANYKAVFIFGADEWLSPVNSSMKIVNPANGFHANCFVKTIFNFSGQFWGQESRISKNRSMIFWAVDVLIFTVEAVCRCRVGPRIPCCDQRYISNFL